MPVQYSKEFVRTRLITFAGIVLGYASFYLTRNSLTYTAPAMVADASLGVSMTDVRVWFGLALVASSVTELLVERCFCRLGH